MTALYAACMYVQFLIPSIFVIAELLFFPNFSDLSRITSQLSHDLHHLRCDAAFRLFHRILCTFHLHFSPGEQAGRRRPTPQA